MKKTVRCELTGAVSPELEKTACPGLTGAALSESEEA